MSDLPLEGRKDVPEPKPDTQAKKTHKVTSKPLSQEELKKIQEQQQKKGYKLEIVRSVPGNELAVIAELLSALNNNVASLSIDTKKIVDHFIGAKNGGSGQ